jgi:hypothetical protein
VVPRNVCILPYEDGGSIHGTPKFLYPTVSLSGDEAAWYSETSVTCHNTAQCHNAEDPDMKNNQPQNTEMKILKSLK